MDIFQNAKKIHLIGIGGINVSAIAKLLKATGLKVSGSDLMATDLTRELEKEGIQVVIGQKPENITPDVDLVIFSDAVPPDNVERLEAKKRAIQSMSAFKFWGEFSRDKKVVAVSGTNGKSTTTAMLGLMMEQAGLDPTVVVGTKVLQWGSNIRIGKSDWLVIEADEYHAHMLELNPYLVVLTNIAP
ncbi:MAG: Mur ligase domain-containing protein, partial [Candidatus Komeilibacteria bacterium]|nr:Mur ligase domain-containing protein [Candidatus Komeilibacteria bacterium]